MGWSLWLASVWPWASYLTYWQQRLCNHKAGIMSGNPFPCLRLRPLSFYCPPTTDGDWAGLGFQPWVWEGWPLAAHFLPQPWEQMSIVSPLWWLRLRQRGGGKALPGPHSYVWCPRSPTPSFPGAAGPPRLGAGKFELWHRR